MRRYVRPGSDAAVWHSSGRWGPSRVPVEECAALRAEDLYTDLLRQGHGRMSRGGRPMRGKVGLTFSRGSDAVEWEATVEWEVRPNAVWRFGRVFLKCPRCAGAATRLYVPPIENVRPACRRCWGLTYRSRQERNYKLSRGWGRARYGLLFSPIVYAMLRADDAREERASAAEKRYAERREILARFALTPECDDRQPTGDA